MRFVEHDNRVRREVLADKVADLGVEQVLVAVDDDVGMIDEMAGSKVGTPAVLLAQGT
jgi:hypothetical protein